MKQEEGKFIVFEGLDGCGKSSQSKKLAKYFEDKGQECVLTWEHTRKKVGALIEDVVNHKFTLDPLALQLCFVADRREHYKSVIEPALEEGKTVVCDRYYWTTVAYVPEDYRDIVFKLNKDIVKSPDITFFIDCPVDECLKRIDNSQGTNTRQSERTIFEKADKLERFSKTYDWLLENDDIVSYRINGIGEIDEIHARIIDKLNHG